MDNLAHALAGAALGQAGLKKQTGLGVATLVIAANLPDIDAVAIVFERSLAWRRGWTHGPIALALLPILLTLAVVAYDRRQTRRGTRPATRAPVRAPAVLLLAYIGILSHPMMDLLNTYGVRLLMPFSERWFYGDALFIIDVWLWLAFGVGVVLSRRRERRQDPAFSRPAILSIVAVSAYAIAMTAASASAAGFVARQVLARGMAAPESVLASPVPVNPFKRRIVVDHGETYAFGELRWTPGPQLSMESGFVPTNMNTPAIARAATSDQRVADFLYWSRLPFADTQHTALETLVTIGDARYNRTPGTGVFTVRTAVGNR